MSGRLPSFLLALLLVVPACAVNPRPVNTPTLPVRESRVSVMLHGKPLELHLSVPTGRAPADALILYASGDGGWFGAAVDMFRRIAGAGYYTVGFSSRAFLKLDRPKGRLVNPEQLAS